MAINFDAAPAGKPGAAPIKDGRYQAEIVSTEVKTTSKGGTALVVKFKTTDGKTVQDWITESDSDFVQFKFSQLFKALNIKVSGSLDIKDMPKLIKKGTKFEVDLTTNDKGYPTIDFSGDKEGYYPVSKSETTAPKTKAAPVLDTEVAKAIGDEDEAPAIDDSEF